ncbi:MAG: 1-(5-phosphoribosyl)-5-[(5-phosphoribosylamino)methylideneamino]imidazole-4-carboxamide isomerase [Armatimonadetes bacterium]|nr:1-(5-phosphoribosyl)-5-[(5-phosphoribosylamino)methylideneamino]imidazole-4-carboxamide isomerase [Armatimonadota bacterium]
MFIVLPAIDLLEGKVVRLTQGRYDAVKVYSNEPAEVALQFERDGAIWLHVVDLEGAKEGEPKNLNSLVAIRSAVKCKIQFGGGIRSLATLEQVFEIGVQRAILGTSAIVNPMLAHEAIKSFGSERIAVALDVREGKVAVHGWMENKAFSPFDLGKKMKDAGIDWFIYTDILRDGTMTSPNLEAIARFADLVKANVIASGGISSVEHVRQIKSLEHLGVLGCIVGRAIYEGKLNLREALGAVGEISGDVKSI